MKCCLLCEFPHEATCATCAGIAIRSDTTSRITTLNAVSLHGQLLKDAGHDMQAIGKSMIVHAAKMDALCEEPPTPTPDNPEGGLAERPGPLRDPDGTEWIIIDSQDEGAGAQ